MGADPEVSPKRKRWTSQRVGLWGCGCATIIAIVLVEMYAFLAPLQRALFRASGGNDMADMWFACEHYARDHDGMLPPLDKEPGRLMFERNLMHADYGITGKSVTMQYDRNAPASWRDYEDDKTLADNTDFIDDHSWWYLGYEISSDAEGVQFLRAYLSQVLAGGSFDADLEFQSNDAPQSSVKLHRLVRPSPPDNKPDADSPFGKIPVFVERPGHYKGYSGGWVMYLDGHREYLDYPGCFPMSADFIEVLRVIDEAGSLLKKHPG